MIVQTVSILDVEKLEARLAVGVHVSSSGTKRSTDPSGRHRQKHEHHEGIRTGSESSRVTSSDVAKHG